MDEEEEVRAEKGRLGVRRKKRRGREEGKQGGKGEGIIGKGRSEKTRNDGRKEK